MAKGLSPGASRCGGYNTGEEGNRPHLPPAARGVVRRKLEDLVGEEGFSEIEEPEPTAPVDSEWESAGAASWSSTTESTGKEEPETEEEETAEPQDAPAAKRAPREEAAEAAEHPEPARQLNDKKSYEQFRRWIKNIQS